MNRRPIIFLATMVALLLVAASSLRETRRLDLSTRGDMKQFAADSDLLDRVFREFTAHGNVLLSFAGFDASSGRDRARMVGGYTRAVYAMYPKRVYVADDETVVGQGFQENPFPPFAPSVAWKTAHQINYVVTMRPESSDHIRFDYQEQ